MGVTTKSLEEVRALVQTMNHSGWGTGTYHLFTHNCNHFTDAFCKALIDRSIPGWVNRISKTAAYQCLIPRSARGKGDHMAIVKTSAFAVNLVYLLLIILNCCLTLLYLYLPVSSKATRWITVVVSGISLAFAMIVTILESLAAQKDAYVLSVFVLKLTLSLFFMAGAVMFMVAVCRSSGKPGSIQTIMTTITSILMLALLLGTTIFNAFVLGYPMVSHG